MFSNDNAMKLEMDKQEDIQEVQPKCGNETNNP